MPVYAVRKNNESVDRVINRFKRQVQQSRIVLLVKNSRFHKKKATKRHVRASAVMREHYRKERKKTAFY